MVDFVPGRAVIDAARSKRGKYIYKCAAIGYVFLPFSFSSVEELKTDAITTSTTVGRLLPPCSSFTNGTATATCQLPQLKSQFHGLKLSHNSSTRLNNDSKTIPLRVYAAKVNKGSVPPAFTLKDQDGKTVSLSKFKGKPLVLYFYPADETPGCTKQACAFRDSYEKFKKAGAQVVGISGDDSDSHKAFAKKYKLPFTLLSDEGNKVRKDWGVPSDLFGTLPGRQTYVLDKNGVVQLVYNNQFQPEKHIDETLKLLQSL
nr:peroxiredoxin Q, chloroplastic [Tanacetum cinerariifolium]